MAKARHNSEEDEIQYREQRAFVQGVLWDEVNRLLPKLTDALQDAGDDLFRRHPEYAEPVSQAMFVTFHLGLNALVKLVAFTCAYNWEFTQTDQTRKLPITETTARLAKDLMGQIEQVIQRWVNVQDRKRNR